MIQKPDKNKIIKKVIKIGKYEVVSKIAEGGMGAVFKAKHPTLNRFIVLKKLTLRGNSTFNERFKREAQLMIDFKNEHIVQVYDHFKAGSSYYIVQEYVDGIGLDALIKRERYIPIEQALLIFYESCKALKYAHDKGVIHRDIKPGNILISKEGEIKLVDFGIATSSEEDDDEKGLTREGMTLGTPSYISPEQIQNTKNVDNRADIYSMGVMLYEMVTGKTPFPGTLTAESIVLIQKGKYKKPHKLNPNITSFVQRLIKKSMRNNVEKRFNNLGIIIKKLEKKINKKNHSLIKKSIKKYINGEKVKQEDKKKSLKQKNIKAAIIIAFCLIAPLTFYHFSSGNHYEIFMSRDYGSLIVSLKLRKDYKDPGNNYIKTLLYSLEGGKLSKMNDIKLKFKENKKKGKAKAKGRYYYLESQKLYLKPGNYRIKINLENELYWETFCLESRELQKKITNTKHGKIINCTLEIVRHLPLKVVYKVIDRETKRNITRSTNFYVFYKSRWMKWNRKISNKLQTGNSYKFKFEKVNYYPAFYSLVIKPYQTVLNLQTALISHPGRLTLTSNCKGLRVFLNNSVNYLQGGRDSLYKKLEHTSLKKQSIILKPGEYILTVQKSKRITKKIKIKIRSNRNIKINVDYNKKKKTINLNYR